MARILGPEIPHPLASAEDANVRERVVKELASVGVTATILEGTGCRSFSRRGLVSCGSVKNVIGEVQPGTGRAIVMLAHYDSVAAGPGAADDESGVATIIETIRALKARNIKSQHPILAVFSDGEEAGALGVDVLLQSAEFRDRVGVVINLEARGNTGPSLLFQTSAGDSKLVDVYREGTGSSETSSLFEVIYKMLPNDTDLSPFLDAGYTGFNFAFSGRVAHYHTPLDRRVNLDRSSLQQQGDNLLGVVSQLAGRSFESLRGGDDIFVPLFSHCLLRVPGGWAVPLALVALVLLVVTMVLSRAGTGGVRAWLRAIAIVPAMLVGAVVIGFAVHTVAALVSGQPDPSFANPTLMRFALGAGVFCVFVACTRLADPKRAALAIWLWMGVLSLVTALLVPGLSPYFLFPTLIASVVLLAQSRHRDAWTGRIFQISLAASALLPLAIWFGLAVTGESVQGLVLHPLFTVPVAFAMIALIPLASIESGAPFGALSKRAWRRVALGSLGLAVLLGVLQGTRPAFSAMMPQRVSLSFVDDHVTNEAYWLADTFHSPLPRSMRSAAAFSAKQEGIESTYKRPTYKAPAGALRFPPTTVNVTQQPGPNGRVVSLSIQAADNVATVRLAFPAGADVRAVTVGNRREPIKLDPTTPLWVWCMSRDCATATMSFEVGNAPVAVTVYTTQLGLPADADKVVRSRPQEAVTSQDGDTTVVKTLVQIGGA